jgi:NADPH:quinone reductase-like Zn-dependent oxidoreductase
MIWAICGTAEGHGMRGCGVSRIDAPVTPLALPSPPPPGPGQILVAVEAAGVGPWEDLVRNGFWDVGLRPPAALGVEGAGRVVAVGPHVTGLAVGDPVVAHEAPFPGGSGFWAEQVLLTAAHVAFRPAALDPVTAAALPVGGLTARQALVALALRPGDRLLITGGAGGTGALAVQLAVRAGLRVTTTASPRSAPRLWRFGVEAVVDYHDPAWLEQIRGLFDGALIAAGGTADAALSAVRDGGRLCSLTSDAPEPERGVTTSNLYVRPDGAELARLAADLAGGSLVVDPEVLPRDAAADALRRVVSGGTGGRKLVLQ